MKKIPVEESFFVGALLALSGGLVDVYTYLIRGGVFAFAQTGNLVLLGIRLARGRLGECVHYLIPILAFTVGVILTEGIQQIFKNHPVLLWQQAALLTEILILAAVAFFPIGKATDNMANIAVSLACGIQVESFRKMAGAAYATTMCTGNLRSAAEALFRFFATKDPEVRWECLRFYGVIGAFVCGVILGEKGVEFTGRWAVLLCMIPLAAALGILFRREKETE